MRLGSVLGTVLLAGCAASGGASAGGMGPDVAATMEVQVTGDSVRFILHMTNNGSEPLELTFPTSQRYDIVVETPAGDEVWRWSDGMSFLQALSRATLAPGESWDMEAVWRPGRRTGDYLATGVVPARERTVRQTARFALE